MGRKVDNLSFEFGKILIDLTKRQNKFSLDFIQNFWKRPSRTSQEMFSLSLKYMGVRSTAKKILKISDRQHVLNI